MATAEIIAIGTELLLGVTLDTNTHFLANQLRGMGIDLYRTTVIGDNADRIAELVREAHTRADIVITTGGLGPTIDDPTRDAIAKAYQVNLSFQPDLWVHIQQRFIKNNRIPSDNNKRQAYLPENAKVIHNPVGTAPAFYVFENNQFTVSLPGVPKEMEYLFIHDVKNLIEKFYPDKSIILIKNIHLIGVGESVVDEKISDLEKQSNPTVGISAKAGHIDVRITAKASTKEEAISKVAETSKVVYEQLGDYIFSEDDVTLLDVVQGLLNKQTQKYNIHLFNHQPDDLLKLKSSNFMIFPLETLEKEDKFSKEMVKYNTSQDTKNIAFAVFYKLDKMILLIYHSDYADQSPILRSYMGPKEDFPQWVYHYELAYLRSLFIS
jgi:competence/damage-inducible protein CinA-like protein